MQHPFEGILTPASATSNDGAGGRRTFLKRAATLLAAFSAGAVGAVRSASAQIYTTQAIGEEGGYWGPYPPGSGRYYPPPPPYPYPPPYWRSPWGRRRWRYTTYAIGEEAGFYGRRRWGDFDYDDDD